MNIFSVEMIFLLLLFSSASVFSQSTETDYYKLKQRYNILSEKDGVLKLEDKLTAKTIVKTKNINNIPSDYNFDLIVDLRTIDTSQYSSIYSLWSEIPIGSSMPLRIADSNYDNRKELYGAYYNENYSFNPSYVIYEINKNGSYDSVYKYPDNLGWVWKITDLENDGIYESVNSTFSEILSWYLTILSTDSIIGYPVKIKSIYYPSPSNGQPVRINLHDMDGDRYPEMIYYLDGSGDSLILGNSNQIAKYNRENHKLELVYQNRPPTYYTSGFAFGDFDSDGKENISVGSILGEVFIYEYVDGNNYNLIRIDSLPISNAYISTFTEDLNSNSKPELWIGGDIYINGVGSTVYYIYEADGNDQYSVVYTIAVIGVIPFYAYNMFPADIDNDGLDEVILCLDQHLLVFKNKNEGFELYYINSNELANHGGVYYSATAADLDGDNYPEILICMDQVENNRAKVFSKIYKKTGTVGVNDKIIEKTFYLLSEAYPNPFNPSTAIKFIVQKEADVSIVVYNLLGQVVKILLSENVRNGEYEIKWNGTDDNGNKVSSGIYIINMITGNFNKSIKTVLIK